MTLPLYKALVDFYQENRLDTNLKNEV